MNIRAKIFVGALIAAVSCTAAALLCCSGGSSGSQAAADQGVAVLRSMADSSDYSFFGYESESDVGSEDIGDPFEIKTVDDSALLASETASDSMIISANEYLFPVTVRGSLIETIRVMLDGEDWEYIATESKAEFQKALDTITANSLVRDECYILDLEEIELSFVGYEAGGRSMLIPLYTGASSSLVVGTKYAFTDIAAGIKSQISAAAAAYNDMVPSDIESAESPALPSVQAAKAAGQTNKLISLDLIAQEQDQWCWAATGRMTMLYAGGDSAAITQCAQANSAFSQTECCDDGSDSACNKPHYPRFSSWGFSASKAADISGASPSWDAFKALMDANKPVAFLWKWKKGGGHYMVAVGYYEDTGTTPATQMVKILNPWPPNVGAKESLTYDKFAGGAKYNNLLTVYFYNITKN